MIFCKYFVFYPAVAYAVCCKVKIKPNYVFPSIFSPILVLIDFFSLQ